MKKTYVIALSTILILSSCKSDDDGGVSSPEGNNPPEITGALAVEEGKQKLEDNSLEILNKVESFKNDSALEQIIELAEFLTSSNSTGAKSLKSENIALKTIANIAELKTENEDPIIFNAQQVVVSAEQTLNDDFEEEKGIYNWNETTEEFDKIAESDDAIYNIAYDGKEAVFTVTDFNSTQVNDNDFPTLSKGNLKIDGVVVYSQEFSASFNEGNDIPADLKNTITIGEFNFVTSHTRNNSLINESIEFKIDDEVITSYSATVNGNFSNNIDEEANVEDVIDNTTITFKFLDATLFIAANDSNLDSEKDLTIDEQITLLNNNVNAELSIEGKSIAKSQFYKDQDTYTSFERNESTGDFEPVTKSEDIVNARFLFEDETTTDFEVYFEDSFTAVEEKYESVFDAFEKLFEDVDLGSDDDDTIEVTPEPIEIP